MTLEETWQAAWPEALAIWSRFTKLSPPRWQHSAAAARAEGLTDSFAMIRFADQAVVVNLEEVEQRKLQGFALQVLAHEIGHHVYCPGDLTDYARMLRRMQRALPTQEAAAPMIQNLYADLLINDRLQRSAGLNMAAVYQAIDAGPTGKASAPQTSLWALYMRIYEILWSLPRKTLTHERLPDAAEGDAQLGARLIRVYARDWMDGSGKFATLCQPYLTNDLRAAAPRTLLKGWADTPDAAQGCDAPAGLLDDDSDPALIEHPAFDPRVNGKPAETQSATGSGSSQKSQSGGQTLDPFAFGQLLRALGLAFSDADVAVRYYRERALPYLVRFPMSMRPQSKEPLHEGYEPWEIGMPVEAVDWMATVLHSPIVIPGMSTVQKTWGVMEGADRNDEPVDLDLYIDCSGSMPNPRAQLSYMALAGAIVALSALRAGSKVQATLWSGTNQFDTTGGFTRDEKRILQVVTGYIGGATAFPLHILRETYAQKHPLSRPAHILVISDDGLSTIYDKDERNTPGDLIAAKALEAAGGGGTWALQLYAEPKTYAFVQKGLEQGWNVSRIGDWPDLIQFARDFSRETYQRDRVERR